MAASAIVDALQAKVPQGWLVGDQRTNRDGAALVGLRPETYCSFFLVKGADGKLNLALSEIAASLDCHRQFFRSFRKTQGLIELFVGWFFETGNSGDEFGPDLLVRLGDLGIGLSFDLFGLSGDPESDAVVDAAQIVKDAC
jgi:hypothetical protein